MGGNVHQDDETKLKGTVTQADLIGKVKTNPVYVIITDGTHDLDITSGNKLINSVYGFYPDNAHQMPAGDAAARAIHVQAANQDDGITYTRVSKATTDGDIIAAPGANKKLRIHHIYVCNAGANVTIFHIEDDTTEKFSYCLAANGGLAAQNLKRPMDLTTNKPLHYDWVSGASAVIYITIGYETIDV